MVEIQAVQSRSVMDWVQSELIRFFYPDFADVLMRGEASEGLKSLGIVVGCQECLEMAA